MKSAREIPRWLVDAAEREMERLQTTVTLGDTKLTLYNAGMSRGRVRFGLFARDLLTTALMLRDAGFSREAIKFVLLTLGKRYDPLTGEEPGRALHEFDGVEIRGLKTHYNAAETSQLLLIASADYLRVSGDRALVERHSQGLRTALDYLFSHIREGLFWEEPQICGASQYALKATYWKDSGLPGRADPSYPVAYTLVQAQTISALRAAAELAKLIDLGRGSAELEGEATKLLEALLDELWDRELNYPLIAKDRVGPISGISSDGLHLLAYLRPEDLPQAKLEAICIASKLLETPYGFRTYAPSQPGYSPTAYHLGAIWPFEQFFIAKGALIHGREELLEVALRVGRALERLGFPELFYWDEQCGLAGPGANSGEGEGCDLQLWSVAWPKAMRRLLRGLALSL
jgi:glycogen debranching enzyme